MIFESALLCNRLVLLEIISRWEKMLRMTPAMICRWCERSRMVITHEMQLPASYDKQYPVMHFQQILFGGIFLPPLNDELSLDFFWKATSMRTLPAGQKLNSRVEEAEVKVEVKHGEWEVNVTSPSVERSLKIDLVVELVLPTSFSQDMVRDGGVWKVSIFDRNFTKVITALDRTQWSTKNLSYISANIGKQAPLQKDSTKLLLLFVFHATF